MFAAGGASPARAEAAVSSTPTAPIAIPPRIRILCTPMPTKPSKSLETFANPKPERDYVIRFDCPEFTCVCPKTGQPDFATIRVEYVPDALCVELKSWKLYLWSYRDVGAFHEAVTNGILDDLVAAVSPRRARIEGAFNVRGGITTTVVAEHVKK